MTDRKSYRESIAHAVGYVYASGIIPNRYRYTDTIDRVYNWCLDFIVREQLPDAAYGVGEGNALDWDEHLEAYIKTRAAEKGWVD